MKIKEKQRLTKKWFKDLQNLICKNIEDLEKKYGSRKKFKKNRWKHGEFRIIEGEVIEKGGVAFSNVIGKFPKTFAKNIPGTKKKLNFWSSGVSVVLHPNNPKIPAMHFNTRFICTEKNWFGGGMDATPCFKDNKEKKIFHNELKKKCDYHKKNILDKLDKIYKMFENLSLQKNIYYLDFINYFCPTDYCNFYHPEKKFALIYDGKHLNYETSVDLSESLKNQFSIILNK